VEILAWLVPAGIVTCVAMLWATWAGRPQRDDRAARPGARDPEHERFARAITREHPAAQKPVPSRVRDRSTGIAVRPSRRSSSSETRRSA